MIEKETVKLEIYPYAISSIALFKETWKIIDQKLNHYMDRLYEYGLRSKYWDKPPISILPAEAMIYARKLLCVFEYAREKANDKATLSIFDDEITSALHDTLVTIYRKVFPDIYQKFMKCKNKISLGEFIKPHIVELKYDFSWEEDIREERTGFLALFGAPLFGVEITDDIFLATFNRFFIDLAKLYSNENPNFRKLTLEDLDKHMKKNGKKLKRDIENDNIFFNKMRFFGAELSGTQEIGAKLYTIPVMNVIMSYLFDIFNVDVGDLFFTNIENKDVEYIYAFASLCRQLYRNLPEDQVLKKLEDIVVISLYTWATLKEYTRLKENYSKLYGAYITEVVGARKEVEEKEKLQKEVDVLRKQIDFYSNIKDYELIKSQLENYKQLCEKLQRENELLKKENSQLKQELDKYKEDIEELAKLRTAVFEEEIETHPVTEIDYSKLKDKRIAIVGGYKGQFSELKEYVQDFIHIEVGRLNYDENILTTVDLVVFVSKILNHTGYYKAINTVKKAGVKYIISSYTNTQKLLYDIVKEIN